MSPRRKCLTIDDVRDLLGPALRVMRATFIRLEDIAEDLGCDISERLTPAPTHEVHVKPQGPKGATVQRIPAGRMPKPVSDVFSELSKMERSLLNTASQYSARPLTSAQLTTYAGYSRRNGDVGVALARLRRDGYLVGTTTTAKGRDALGSFEPLPTGAALREYWLAKLSSDIVARRFFKVICDAYPHELTLDEAYERAGYSRRNGDVAVAIAKLRRLDLITQRAPLQASPMLFE